MHWKSLLRPRPGRVAIAALVAICAAAGVGVALASDHQDTPDVELNPEMDLTDLYVFPSPVPGRVVLVMNSWGVLSPAETPTTYFDPNILYQFKIDNDRDGVEDKVIQVTFNGSGQSQSIDVRGPMAPPVGTARRCPRWRARCRSVPGTRSSSITPA